MLFSRPLRRPHSVLNHSSNQLADYYPSKCSQPTAVSNSRGQNRSRTFGGKQSSGEFSRSSLAIPDDTQAQLGSFGFVLRRQLQLHAARGLEAMVVFRSDRMRLLLSKCSGRDDLK